MRDEATNTEIAMAPDVEAELLDERFGNRQHYSRATYALGCRGPLCQLAEKHRGRRRNKVRAEAAGREYQADQGGRRKNTRDAELAPVISWHLSQRRMPANK